MPDENNCTTDQRLDNCAFLVSDPDVYIAHCSATGQLRELEAVALDCIYFADADLACAWMREPLNEILQRIRGAQTLTFFGSLFKSFDSFSSLGGL